MNLLILVERWNVLAAVAMEEGHVERASAIRQCIDELQEELEDSE